MALILISCGRNREPDDTGTNHAYGAGPRPGDTGDANPVALPDLASAFDRDLFNGETLTISVSSNFAHMYALASAYMRQNPGVIVEVIDNTVQLEEGTVPVLMCFLTIDRYDPHNARNLADWLPIMNASPYFNEEEYFMNVFHAAAVDGRLYAFPTRFSYRMVVANSTIPGLVSLLGTYNDMYGGVTISQQMEMMRLLGSELSHMYLDSYFDVFVGIWDYLYNFIDIETRRVDFYNYRFKDFITNARELTCPDTIYGQMRISNRTTHAQDLELRERYFFQHIGDSMFQYFVNFGEDFHGNYFAFEAPTPIDHSDVLIDFAPIFPAHDDPPQHDIVAPALIVSSHGELLITIYDSFVLNANANTVQQALALDFMEFATSAVGNMMAGEGLNPPRNVHLIPVNRELYARVIWDALFNVLGNRDGVVWQWLASHGQIWINQLNDIAAHLLTIGDMPMISTQMPHAITNIIFEELEAFHNGSVSAEETARNLQNRISFVLH